MRSSIRHPLQSIRLRQQPHIKWLGASAVPKRIPNTPNQVLSISGAAILQKRSVSVRSHPMRTAQCLHHEQADRTCLVVLHLRSLEQTKKRPSNRFHWPFSACSYPWYYLHAMEQTSLSDIKRASSAFILIQIHLDGPLKEDDGSHSFYYLYCQSEVTIVQQKERIPFLPHKRHCAELLSHAVHGRGSAQCFSVHVTLQNFRICDA